MKAIIVAGPTASGKSALAARIAREFGGIVVNADSMQVYSGMPILTASPDEGCLSLAPHLLYGVLAPQDSCSVGRWLDMARKTAKSVQQQGKIPVIVGGTGLYLQSLTKGLAPAPDIPDSVREEGRRRLLSIGNQAFYQELAALDPKMAAELHPSNSQRLVRAWEVMTASGRSLADWRMDRHQGQLDADFFSLLLLPPAKEARSAAEGRFFSMIEQGALGEAEAIRALDLDPALPASKVLGLAGLIRHLEGEITLNEAIEQAQIATNQYAKRQRTWFRHRFMADFSVSAQLSESATVKIFSIIRQFLLTKES